MVGFICAVILPRDKFTDTLSCASGIRCLATRQDVKRWERLAKVVHSALGAEVTWCMADPETFLDHNQLATCAVNDGMPNMAVAVTSQIDTCVSKHSPTHQIHGTRGYGRCKTIVPHGGSSPLSQLRPHAHQRKLSRSWSSMDTKRVVRCGHETQDRSESTIKQSLSSPKEQIQADTGQE